LFGAPVEFCRSKKNLTVSQLQELAEHWNVLLEFHCATVWRLCRGLHILVNNAGFTWDAVIHKTTVKQWETMFKVHCTAPFRLVQEAEPYMRGTALAATCTQRLGAAANK